MNDWAGFYAGVQAGGGWARNHSDYSGGPAIVAIGATGGSNGLFGGVHVGYNWRTGSLVFGLEADLEASGIRGIVSFANGARQFRSDIRGSFRGRAGYSFDRALLYLTGGVAWDALKFRTLNLTTQLSDTAGSARAGWTLGAGVEYAIADNWKARIEYRYADFGAYARTTVSSFPGVNERHRYTESSIRLGVSYAFGR